MILSHLKMFYQIALKVLNRPLLSYSIDGSGPPIRFSIAPGSLQKFLKILTDQSLNMCRLKRRKKSQNEIVSGDKIRHSPKQN